MRKIIVLAAALAVTPAAAAEVSIKMEDQAQNIMLQLPALFDQCISAVVLRGDSTICKSISSVLTALSNDTRSAQAQAKATADAKAAEEAKKADKPAEAN